MVDNMLYRHTQDADDRVRLPVDPATPAPQIRKLQRHTLSLSASLRLLYPNAANSVLNPFLAFFNVLPESHTASPRNSAAPQTSSIPASFDPSSPEFSPTKPAAVPTKSREPQQARRPPHQTDSHPTAKNAVPAIKPPPPNLAALRRADPAVAPPPALAVPESAVTTAPFACKTRIPHQRTTTLARAALSRP